ncbi:LOW QUALITY PROTEIN: GDH/6PGL endoplasmic bifunctional protein-like [Dendronephthya gigantea]|uniref:LOW QUALITY PROTEIN: GDH/6PGL endoplasmic bifunctional protein-like n=1 Tax=Dendronephthya gigantea TaxID=151771 RepID=UPI00106D28A0|nr:LOW QUALITY PROTEIN: GDH/6PGL endoplasmic bifunctional protein-like [Dendronephthya gigantea]
MATKLLQWHTLFFALYFSHFTSQNQVQSKPKHRVNIILFGATGDLAKRYLWNGFFNLYLSVRGNSENTMLRFYGATRVDAETGSKALVDILNTSIRCSNVECEKQKIEFMKVCMYYRLKHSVDFEKFQNFLQSSLTEEEIEVGRIYYLSVPPFAYAEISKNIAENCRPKSPNTWIRVVLEKPFGSDLKTATELSEKMSKYWKEVEIYRIDHYLGKAGVAQIMEFKKENLEFFDTMWNRDYIEQVNIVVKERLDAKGRMSFYDQYGVIRDVFQNHLTEILVLVALEMSQDNSEKSFPNSKKYPENTFKSDEKNFPKLSGNSEKLRLLEAVKAVTIHDAVFGQYKGYNTQLKNEVPSVEYDRNTPTFSAVVMNIQNQRWAGVPFVLVSGKSLDTRLAYVQVKFKQQKFCIENNLDNEPENCKPRELTFYIQGEHIDYPVTMFSSAMSNMKFGKNWKNVLFQTEIPPNLKSDYIIMKPPHTDRDAYSSLIQELFLGNRDMFVSIEDLLLSWKIWDPLIKASTYIQPRLYTKEDIESLDFELVKGKIKFVSEARSDCQMSGDTKYLRMEMEDDQSHSFRGNKLVSGHLTNVVQQLAKDIASAIQVRVESGGTFNLALSGGSTAKHLFHALAYMKYFSWDKVHVWLVDERCVSLNHKESNFQNMYEYFLKHIHIPYWNIHSMPVDNAGQYCHSSNLGEKQYEKLLRYHLVNGSLDFVVLGVGNDGHTASLFPGIKLLTSTNWVELTTSFGGYTRMTMTLSLLNQSKNIAVLILGQRKHDIVQKLLQAREDTQNLPITAINPVYGTLVWYIEDSLLY